MEVSLSLFKWTVPHLAETLVNLNSYYVKTASDGSSGLFFYYFKGSKQIIFVIQGQLDYYRDAAYLATRLITARQF